MKKKNMSALGRSRIRPVGPDERHIIIIVQESLQRRIKVYAAIHGLTQPAAIAELLDKAAPELPK